MKRASSPLGRAGRLAVAFVRAATLLPLRFLALTAFALWPWRLGPPFFLVRPLGLLRRAPRASRLRLALLRLELRTTWTSRAPGRVRADRLRRWLVRPLGETWPACRQLARRERRHAGLTRVERLTRFLDALPDSYRYGNGIATRFWYDADRRAQADHHIPNLPYHVRLSCCLLNHALNPSLPAAQRHFDKVAFHEVCRAHGWPTVPVFASFRSGVATRYGPLPDRALLSKPSELAEGRGHFERWCPVEPSKGKERRYRGDRGEVLDEEGLFAHLERRSRGSPYLLQQLIRSHEAIRTLAGVDTLCTLRLPTCRHVDGRVDVLPLSLFRIPTRRDVVFDNMGQGGIAYRVDLDSGRLQPGVTYGDREPYHVHPLTGRPAVGFEVPFLREAVDLVRDAHDRGFSTFPSLGWDVALTSEGPLLLEVNIQWGAEHDIPQEGFLGRTPYVDCILGHLERLWPEAVGRGAAPVRPAKAHGGPATRVVGRGIGS